MLTLGSNGTKPLFADCPLESLYIGGRLSYDTSKSLGYSPFYGKTSLRHVVIADGETTIYDNEFYGCSNLTDVTIGDGVTSIGVWAFLGCKSLTQVTLGKSVESIGEEAFSDCTSLTCMVSKAVTPPVCEPFAVEDPAYSDCELIVPIGCVASYKKADGWRDFYSIIEETPEDDVVPTIGSVVYLTQSSASSDATAIVIDPNNAVTLTDGGYSLTSTFYGTATAGVNYIRNFSSDKWQALYVPFDIPVTAELLADFEFAKINDTHQYDDDEDGKPDRTTIEFFKVKEGALAANTPYLIRAKVAGKKTISIPETTLYPADECSIDCSTTDLMFTFYGVYRKRMADDIMGSYAMGGGSLVRAESSDVTLAPYRFYMTAEKRDGSGAIDLSIKLRIVSDGETTDIDYIPAEMPTDAKYYDVWGRQYDAPVEGINIVNGKKYINK